MMASVLMEDLRAGGLAGVLAQVLASGGADADTARIAAGLLGRLPGATAVMDNYMAGTPLDSAEVLATLDTAIGAASALVATLTEAAVLVRANPGTLVTEHYDHRRPEPALAIGPRVERRF